MCTSGNRWLNGPFGSGLRASCFILLYIYICIYIYIIMNIYIFSFIYVFVLSNSTRTTKDKNIQNPISPVSGFGHIQNTAGELRHKNGLPKP